MNCMELLATAWHFIGHLDAELDLLLQQYGIWIYLILFLIVFCETGLVVAPFLPGDSLLFASGALWASASMRVEVLALTLVGAAFSGDNCNYWIGRLFGSRIANSRHPRFLNRRAWSGRKPSTPAMAERRSSLRDSFRSCAPSRRSSPGSDA